MNDVAAYETSIDTLWLVHRLSTCLSQHATHTSLQIDLMASNISVDNTLSRDSDHPVYSKGRKKTYRSVKFAPNLDVVVHRHPRPASTISFSIYLARAAATGEPFVAGLVGTNSCERRTHFTDS
jgi:hypothetical protein